MSKQELLNKITTWAEFDDLLEKDRKDVKDIDPMKHLLNKMNVQVGSPVIFEDERKDEVINQAGK